MPVETYGERVSGEPYFGYGDSFMPDPHGRCVAAAGMHDETLMIANINLEFYQRPPGKKSRSHRSAEVLLQTLKDAL